MDNNLKQTLIKFKKANDERYAKPDGNYPTLTSGLADNFTPYSEDSGASQENPFISNGTGTNNNTKIVTVGDYGLLKEKQGNTLVVNQYAYELSSTNYSDESGSRTFDATNNSSTIVVNSSGSYAQQIGRLYSSGGKFLNIINGHKYLVSLSISFSKNISFGNISLRADIDYVIKDVGNLTANVSKTIFGIITATSSYNSRYGIVKQSYFTSDYDDETLTYKDLTINDITQMFNGNIPQDLLDHPEHFSWYYNGDLSYNTGSLVNANGVKLVSTGRNIYNPNETYNVVIPNKPFFASKTTTITYYDKDKNVISTESVSAGNTFTTPSNCVFINSSVSAITITPYYTEQQGGEGYLDSNNVPIEYPYEAPYVVDTGTEVLLPFGYKTPDGTIYKGKSVDLGTLNYTKSGGVPQRFSTTDISSLIAKPDNDDTLCYTLCLKYVSSTRNTMLSSSPTNMTVAVSSSGTLYIADENFINQTAEQLKSALDGVILYYKPIEYTTEQGTPFAENLPINDYGMLYWLDENDNLVGIPQGAKIFYPTNYKGFADDMYSRVDGDSGKYVIDMELTAEETERSSQDTILQNAIGGTLRQCLCVKESLDFDNTDFVDLGSLTWQYFNTGAYVDGPFFRATISNKNAGLTNLISTKYKTNGSTPVYQRADKTIGGHATNQTIDVRDTTYTNATAFKNAMKGVLLAYEKESA